MSQLSGVPGKKFVPRFSARPRYPEVAQVPLAVQVTDALVVTATSLVSAMRSANVPDVNSVLFQFLCLTPGTPARSVGASAVDRPELGSFTTIGVVPVGSSALWSDPKLMPML